MSARGRCAASPGKRAIAASASRDERALRLMRGSRSQRTTPRSAGGGSCLLAKEQSWRTAWLAGSLLSRTTRSGAQAPPAATRRPRARRDERRRGSLEFVDKQHFGRRMCGLGLIEGARIRNAGGRRLGRLGPCRGRRRSPRGRVLGCGRRSWHRRGPESVFSPGPPTRRSLPLPPARLSLPGPPSSPSSPASPCNSSSPPPSRNVSLPLRAAWRAAGAGRRAPGATLAAIGQPSPNKRSLPAGTRRSPPRLATGRARPPSPT